MAKVPIALRLQPETLDWLDGYARSRGSSRQVILEAAVESFRADVMGGVPDLPPEPARVPASVPAAKPKLGSRIVRASKLSPASPVATTRQAQLNKAKAS